MIAEFTIYLEQNYCIGDWKLLGGGGELCKLGHYCIDLSNGEGVALRKGYITSKTQSQGPQPTWHKKGHNNT